MQEGIAVSKAWYGEPVAGPSSRRGVRLNRHQQGPGRLVKLAEYRTLGGAEPPGERKVDRFGWTFAPGDKIMQIENDYDIDVYNGVRSCDNNIKILDLIFPQVPSTSPP
jgi:hypothetical protein